MNEVEAEGLLDKEWEKPHGFLGGLREGVFDPEGARRLESILRSIEPSDGRKISRRLVALTWFIPTFMSWQSERIGERGGNIDELEASIDRIVETLYRVLGVP